MTITANVSGSSSVPAGSVNFADTTTGANLCTNVSVSSNGTNSATAACSAIFATADTHTITLTFSPTTGASTSSSYYQTVRAFGTWVLRLTTPPGNGLGGAALSQQPVVKLLVGPFSPVPTTAGNITVALLDQGGATLPATATRLSQAGVPCENNACAGSASTGVASFNLSVDKLLGPDISRGYSTYLLHAVRDGALAVGGVGVFPGAQSAQFRVTTGPPSQLTLGDTPRGAAKPQFLHSALQVELDDAGGNPVVTDSTDTVTVQLLDAATSSAPMAVSSTGTLTSTIGSAAPGRAEFNDLSITQNGDYILRLTSSAGVPSVDVGSIYAATGNPTYTTFNTGTPADSFRADPAQPVFIRDNQLVITAGPTKGVVDTALDPFVVQLTDASGVVQSSNATVILYATAPGVAAGGARKLVAPAYQNETFCPANFATAQTGGCYVAEANLVAGRATFSGIVVPSLSSGAGRYSFVARLAPGSAPYTPAQVTCSSYGAPSSGCVSGGNTAPGAWPSFVVSDKKLKFNSDPGGATTGQPLSQNPKVGLATSAGTTIGDSYHTVTVSLADSAGNALAGPSLNATGCVTGSIACTAKVSSGATALSGPSAGTAGTGSPNPLAQTVTAATSATLSFSTPGVQPVSLPAGTAGTGATVTATANGAADDTFTLIVTLQYPDGSAVPAGVTFSAAGASCALATCTVTLVTLNGTTAVNTALGNTTINVAGVYTLRASGTTLGGGANGTIDSASITTATSTAFAVTAPAPSAGSHLSFTTPPGSFSGGTPLTPAPVVSLLTSTGVVQTTDSANTVTITLANTAGAPVLSAATAMTSLSSAVACTAVSNSCTTVLVHGVASFTGIVIDKAGSYILLASTTAPATAPATSNIFIVGAGVSSLIVSGSPNPSAPNQLVTMATNITTTSTSFAIGYMWFQDSAIAQPICMPTAVTSGGANIVTGTCSYTFTSTGAHAITVYYCPTFPTATSGGGTPITYTCPSGGALGTYTQNVSSAAVSPKLSGPGCASDGLSCTVTLINGGATFSGLSIDTAGTYTLVAVTNAISADGRAPAAVSSASFSVTAPSGNSGGGGNTGTSTGSGTGGAAGGAAPPAPPPAEAPAPAPLAAEPPAPAPPPAATVPEAAPPSPPTISPEVADQLSSMLLNLGVASDADPETVLAALLVAAPPEVIDALQALSPEDQLAVVQQLLNPPPPPDQPLPDAASTPDEASAPE